MQGLEKIMLARAEELLNSGAVNRVIGWKQGENYYDNSPATFTKDNFDGFVYNGFCGSNLSKYLVNESKKEGKALVFLKPCDTYSFNQLLSEHRIDREKFFVIGMDSCSINHQVHVAGYISGTLADGNRNAQCFQLFC